MIRIITDGACSGNPGPGGWAAIIIRDGEVEELGGYEPQTTNNRMEMRAAIEGLRRVPADAPVHIVSDSFYLIKGMTQWLRAWKARGWVTAAGTPVLNQDLWEELDRLAGTRVTWELVKGHAGHPENERADAIAQAYSQRRTPPPRGARPAATPDPVEARPRRASRPAPAEPVSAASLPPHPGGVTYLSLAGGQLRRHATWEECRQVVHGASGARFKKCKSADEEAATLRSWRVTLRP